MKLLGDEKENRGVRDEDEKEALGFFDEFQKATDEDFCKEFDGETDNQTLNEMLESRIKFLEKIIDLCERLDEHKKRAEHEMNKLTLYNKALLKADFVGRKGNDKSTLKSKVEQLYQELNSKESIPKFRHNLLSTWQAQWEQGKGIGETKESRMARERTIKGILQLCQELEKEKLGRRFEKEALRFYEDLWTVQYDQMDVPAMKQFLCEVKDLASSVGDHDLVELYQDALQDLINTGKKPGPSFRQKEPQAPSSKRLSSTHGRDSDEKEEIEVGSEEIEVTSKQDIEKDAEADEGSEEGVEVNSEMTSEAKIGVSWGFTEMENSCTVIHREIVKEEGVTWYLEEGSACLTFHPGAVTQPTLITCSLWSPSVLSPPLHGNEALVSNIIEVCLDNPPELESTGHVKGGVTVALLHSACELKGYELVIKQLVDPDNREWIDLKTQSIWHFSGSPDRLINLAEASCPVTRRSFFAVIWRLKSFQFSRQNSLAPDFTCRLPDYPDVSVTIPSNSVQVNEDFCLTVKVHEFPSSKVKKEGLFLGPALHISCSPNVTLLKAATIKIPLLLREDKGLLDTDLSSGHLRILHYSSTKEGSPAWTEITQTSETKATVTDGIVTLQVNHFSGFALVMDWVGQPFVVVKDLVCDLYRRLMAQWAGFKAYLCQDADPNKYVLTLFCYPIHLESKVKDLSSEYFVVLQGEGTSSIPLCGQDRMSVNLSESFSVKQEILQKFCLMFWEKRPNHNSLPVNQVVSTDMNVKLFPRWKGEETTELCTLYLIPRSPVQVSPHASFEHWPHGDQLKREEKKLQRERSLGLKVKEGNPTGEELELLAARIAEKWKPLGRRLNFDEASLIGFDRDHSEYREKVYAMLLEWKQGGGATNATYQILYEALCHELVACTDLAEKFCCQ